MTSYDSPNRGHDYFRFGSESLVDELKIKAQIRAKQSPKDYAAVPKSKSRRDFEKYLKEEAQRRTGSSNFVEPSRKSHQNGLSSKLNKNEVLYKKEAELKPLKRRSKRREGDRRTGFEQGGLFDSHGTILPVPRDGRKGGSRRESSLGSETEGYSSAAPVFHANTPEERSPLSRLHRVGEEEDLDRAFFNGTLSGDSDYHLENGGEEDCSNRLLGENGQLILAEEKIVSLKKHIQQLHRRNSQLSRSFSRQKQRNSEGSTQQLGTSVRLMQELKSEEIEATVAHRVAAVIEEIHGEQRKRDEALLKQVREARTEREHLLQHIDSLKEEVQFLQKSPEEQLKCVIKDDSEPSVEMLLREVETAPSSVELEMAGKVLVDRIQKTRATASQIRDEEMTQVVQERDQAVEKLKEMEMFFFSVDKFAPPPLSADNSKEKQPQQSQKSMAAKSPSDNAVNRALKNELRQSVVAREAAVKKSEQVEQDMNMIRQYLMKSGPSGEQLLRELGDTLSTGMGSNEDPLLVHLERQSGQLADRLEMVTKQKGESERKAKELQTRNEQKTQ
ncbi:mirror-image polydactyly gene 1 protein-like isoform X2 [Symsagittifera roscoffensis]|uniref:mirror-image polydactyly gene 1 protein-like isoform X2 n=1 Tax=Symsagittifera roscoffensis TaxID=84072 RepID=UPI00307BED51